MSLIILYHITLGKMVTCTYTCMTIKGPTTNYESYVKIHIFTVNSISTYVVEPIGDNYGGWYDVFPSKRFDSLEEATMEVVTLNQQPAFL